MRYQTPDRRQALLDELIDVELLAREAERRGLDKRPETIELVRQFQRDEVLRRLRASLPGPKEIPAAEVSRYYTEHSAEFREPERRRAAQIALADEGVARRVLAEARTADTERWAALVRDSAPGEEPEQGDATTARPALTVPGDLGVLTLAEPESGSGAPVPEALRRAVFEIERAGQVLPRLVADGGSYHVLRLVSVIESHQRSLEEADAAIRLKLVETQQAEAREHLIAHLRKSIKVNVDEAALDSVPPPRAASPEQKPAEQKAAPQQLAPQP
jgi:peptidyl-prolyl cis-trans isomerase C